MAKKGIIGIDIGGSKTLFALFDDKFEVVEEIKVKTQPEKGEKAFTDRLTENVNTLLDKAKRKDLALVGVGVGCAGLVDPAKGTMKFSPNIPFLKGYPFATRLSKLTGANVAVANDVQAGLWGEFRLGAAQGRKHVIGIFIGTGIGGALIVDGQLYLGTGGLAGNIGNYLMHPVGGGTGSEREGILDDIASRTAIAGAAATLAYKQWAPALFKDVGADVARIKSGNIAAAIEKGDKKIEELVKSRARIVGIALSNMVDFLNPDMVVLGGGLVEAMPALILKEVRAGIDENATPEARDALEVVVAKLKGHAVTTGAAKLAFDTFLSSGSKPMVPEVGNR